ncbi:MAG: hypothetical protein ACR2HH_16895 [Chthoniobacterales bacterium]
MDPEIFIRWALDPARTIEDRYTTELLVELGVRSWNAANKISDTRPFEETLVRSRERKLNPAYEPHYTEEELRKAAGPLAELKTWWAHCSDRPVRSLEPLRFTTALESLNMAFGEPVDISPLAELPHLQTLALGYPGADRYNKSCTDYTPLTRCRALRDLTLGFGVHWPDFTGFETLHELEALHLSGNLLALPRGLTFPNVRRGSLYCLPLAARDVADLPQLPACQFLTLCGAERLDAIERFPHLRNLTIRGPFQSFEPLAGLQELTCLIVGVREHTDPEHQPRDVAPLARLPRLLYFKIGPDYSPDRPRDYSPLVEAPALRELVVQQCPPVAMEVGTINAGLAPWDDLFLAPEPRPLAPLRLIIAPADAPSRPSAQSLEETGDADPVLREREAGWVNTYAARIISERIGHTDWGSFKVNEGVRSFILTVESFEVVERLPEILEAARTALAHLRHEYIGMVTVQLKVRPTAPSPAQTELDNRLQELRDEWEQTQHQREQAEYLDRLHQLELKKQQGVEIDPEEFSPTEQPPYPQMEDILPAKDDVDDSNSDDDGGIAIETDPDPPEMMFADDEHPLANNYFCAGTLSQDEVWFYDNYRGIAVHLMGREPDLEIPKEDRAA